MKKFEFREGTTKGLLVTTEENAIAILHERDKIGVIFKEPAYKAKNLAPWRIAILVRIYDAVNVTHILKARFRTSDDAKAWALEKQQAMFDQYVICKV